MTELPSTLKMKPFGSMCLEGSFMDMPHEGISCTLTGPALLFFKNGQLRDQVTGMASKKDLLGRIDALA